MAGYSVTFTVVDQATRQIDLINRRIAAMHAPIERMSRSVQKFIDVSGLRKIADGFNWIARAAGTVLRSLTAIVPVLGAITGAATITGMVKLVSSFAAWGNQLKTNADQIGITADELQKYQDATTRAGGSAADMTETLKSLHTISADAFTGMNRDAMAYFKRFNIDVADANGHLKSATQLLPEVFHALDSLKDPADRSRVAAAMLGDAQAKLYEEYKQSGKPLQDWLNEEENHKRLTDEQLEQLNRYRLAQASLGTTFDQLGRQMSAVLANNFTPLLQHLDDFVQKHQPEIIAAIDNISNKFAAWLEKPETWKAFEDGAKSVVDALVWITTHLDEIKTAAEVIAGVFALKWAGGMVGSIKAVAGALGSTEGAAATGTGLLGALGSVAAIATALAAAYGAKTLLDKGSESVERHLFGDARTDERKRLQEEGHQQFLRQIPSWMGGTGGATGGLGTLWDRAMKGPEAIQRQAAQGATGSLSGALGITPEQYDAFRGSISNIESRGQYDIMGGSSGRFAGKYQMGADEIKETAARLGVQAPTREQFLKDPSMQEKFFENYTLDHHNWLMAHNAKYAAMSPEDKAAALAYAHNQGAGGASKWIDTGMEGRDAFGTSGAAYSTAVHTAFAAAPAAVPGATPPVQAPAQAPEVQLAQAPPAAPPAAAPPVNGAVSVDITHRNPPPDASVTAQGSGAVNVAPPRIEHPQLDFTTA